MSPFDSGIKDIYWNGIICSVFVLGGVFFQRYLSHMSKGLFKMVVIKEKQLKRCALLTKQKMKPARSWYLASKLTTNSGSKATCQLSDIIFDT